MKISIGTKKAFSRWTMFVIHDDGTMTSIHISAKTAKELIDKGVAYQG